MSTALVSTGVQFPDSTIQTTAAVTLSTVTYANRGNLRTTTPSANLTSIAVEGLGVFTYYATGQTEPDDDESCFNVSGGGSWLLTSPTWDLVTNWQLSDNQNIIRFAPNTITSVATLANMVNSVTLNIPVPGATPMDGVDVYPINGSVTSSGSYRAYVNIPGNVVLTAIAVETTAIFTNTLWKIVVRRSS